MLADAMSTLSNKPVESLESILEAGLNILNVKEPAEHQSHNTCVPISLPKPYANLAP